jgi:hypothetical protein
VGTLTATLHLPTVQQMLTLDQLRSNRNALFWSLHAADPRLLQRVRRCTIVNLRRVKSLRAHMNGEYFLTLEGTHELKMSRTYGDKVALSQRLRRGLTDALQEPLQRGRWMRGKCLTSPIAHDERSSSASSARRRSPSLHRRLARLIGASAF